MKKVSLFLLSNVFVLLGIWSCSQEEESVYTVEDKVAILSNIAKEYGVQFTVIDNYDFSDEVFDDNFIKEHRKMCYMLAKLGNQEYELIKDGENHFSSVVNAQKTKALTRSSEEISGGWSSEKLACSVGEAQFFSYIFNVKRKSGSTIVYGCNFIC